MLERLTQSINALRDLLAEQQNTKGRAIVIWTGPGWPLIADYDSGPGPERLQGNFSDVLAAISTNFREAQVTLDAISPGEFGRPKEIRKADVSATAAGNLTREQAAEEGLALPALAHESGGQALEKSRNFGEALAACFKDAEWYYAASFDSAPARARDELRHLDVKVNRPGTVVRTIPDYYAQP